MVRQWSRRLPRSKLALLLRRQVLAVLCAMAICSAWETDGEAAFDAWDAGVGGGAAPTPRLISLTQMESVVSRWSDRRGLTITRRSRRTELSTRRAAIQAIRYRNESQGSGGDCGLGAVSIVALEASVRVLSVCVWALDGSESRASDYHKVVSSTFRGTTIAPSSAVTDASCKLVAGRVALSSLSCNRSVISTGQGRDDYESGQACHN
jgi:hypothetical protein